MELSSNIKVFSRFRPINEKTESKLGSLIIKPKDKCISLSGHTYEFDDVFDEKSTQEQVYQTLIGTGAGSRITDIFNGYNVTLFAMGMTGCLDPETEVWVLGRGFEKGKIVYIPKKAREIEIGDYLLGDDLEARKVMKIFLGIDEMFEVSEVLSTSSEHIGDIDPSYFKYTVNSSHILTLFDTRINSVVDVLISSIEDPRHFRSVYVCSDKKIKISNNTIQIKSKGPGFYYGCELDGNGIFLLECGSGQRSDVCDIREDINQESNPRESTTILGLVTHNSGNTHSMSGYSHIVDQPVDSKVKRNLWKDPKDMGLVPRIIKAIFERINKAPDEMEFTISLSYVEIYLETIQDLLNPKKKDLKVREGTNGVYIEGVTESYVSSFDDTINLLRLGESNRSIGATEMNKTSSRSHSVVLLTLTQINTLKSTRLMSKMVFIDLAGSEKVSKTGASGITLREAQYTNKSLSTLGMVIRKILDKSPHVPFRDSKLTRILENSLTGNAKTIVLVTCSPGDENEEETISTLRFGTSIREITTAPQINIEMNIEQYKALVESEKKKNQDLIEIIKACYPSDPELVKKLVKLGVLGGQEQKTLQGGQVSGGQDQKVQQPPSNAQIDSLKAELLKQSQLCTELKVQVSDLTDDIKDRCNQIEALKSELLSKEGFKEENDRLHASVHQLTNDLSEADKQIRSLNSTLKQLKRKTNKEEIPIIKESEFIAKQIQETHDELEARVSEYENLIEIKRKENEILENKLNEALESLKKEQKKRKDIEKRMELMNDPISKMVVPVKRNEF